MKNKKEYICKECKKLFTPTHHGNTKKFCSQRCSVIYQWRTRKLKPRKVVIRECDQCKKAYSKPSTYSSKQWKASRYCSQKCTGEAQKIKDGMTTHERGRRKRGQLKKGTEAWLERIKATTKEGMSKPEVKEKLSKPKGSMSLEGRIIRSDALKGMMPKNLTYSNSAFPNVQRGDYECSKGSVYFRSKWEANYALYLDFLIKQNEIKNWEYEAETFFFEQIKLGTRSYRPDFKIYNPDDTVEYHEVKGYMDSRSKTKLKRMEKYFPEVKLILIDREYYAGMLKKLKGVIKFY